MFYRVKRALRRSIFNHGSRAILRAAPILQNNDQLTLASMICHGEISMYLLAVASFCQQFGSVPRIVVLDDGSLTPRDYATLRTQLRDIQILGFSDVPKARCPRGGCWERLLLISDLVKDSYVIQLDSDTLTRSEIPEVRECVSANRSFTLLGDGSYPFVEPMIDACARYKNNLDPMVQAVCERSFDQLKESPTLNYLRGNAGFTGFAKGSITRERVEWFSDRMRTLAHEQWDHWGSEQLVSNLLIANCEGAYPLPFPKYLSHWVRPEVSYDDAAFIHFIGPHRFANGLYMRSAQKVLRNLPQATSKRKFRDLPPSGFNCPVDQPIELQSIKTERE
jgi:hypothetical protein